MAFDQTTRNRLNRFVADARKLLASEFTRQLQATYGMNPVTGDVADIKTLVGLTPTQQESAQLLRDTFEHYLASGEKGKEKEQRLTALDRIVREQAFTVLNRIAALRMSEARGFLIESLANGYESKGFQLFHRIAGSSLGEAGDAYRHYLFSIFDEFSLDLSVLFDRFSAQGRLFPSTPVLLELLTLVNDDEITQLWAEDETIGWIYQYFNSQEERKKMREASQAPRNSRELAVRNQFFTPRYVVEFLTDNTLGRIWYEMTKGETKLVDKCEYLIRRPNEIFLMHDEQTPKIETSENLSQEELLKQTVYIEHRKLKDPRDIKMLDPACGSMHFGLYCFDLFERIYDEAWDFEETQGVESFIRDDGKQALSQTFLDKADFLKHVPRLIIENNIHGVDIDPRAAQVAGLSLWQRAHNSWQQAGVKPRSRPQITKSNIVCAEPMPGEKELLQEFTSQLKPTVLGQLVEVIFEKMQLAGEAGTLLKIEKEIEEAIAGAKAIWQEQNKALNHSPNSAKVIRNKDEIYFDVNDIDDEGFWQQAEQKILDALAIYSSSAAVQLLSQKRLFASDVAKGFEFIDLCKQRFDIVIMNPPFGAPTTNKENQKYLSPSSNNNLYAAFVERGLSLLNSKGFLGALTDRTFMLLPTYQLFREKILDHGLIGLFDLNWGVLDGAQVATSAYVVTNNKKNADAISSWFIDGREEANKESLIKRINSSYTVKYLQQKTFRYIPTSPFAHWAPDSVINSFSKFELLEDTFAIVRKGISPGDSERFVKLMCEVPQNLIGLDVFWAPYTNGGSFSPYARTTKEVLNWFEDGKEIKNFTKPDGKPKYVIRSRKLYGQEGLTFGKRGEVLNSQNLLSGSIFSNEGYIIKLNPFINKFSILGYLNSSIARYMVNMICGLHKEVGAVKKIPIPEHFSNNSFLIENTEFCFELCLKLNASEVFRKVTSLPQLSVSGSFKDWIKNLVKMRTSMFDELNEVSEAIDHYCFEELDFNQSDTDEVINEINRLKPSWKVDLPITEITVSKDLISNAIGIHFGWLSLSKNTYPGVSIIENSELVSSVKNILDKSFEDDAITFICNYLGQADLISYMSKSNLFFDDHLNKFTKGTRKAPIYFPLQLSANSLIIWIYYHDLTDQSILACVNNIINPKLDYIEMYLTSLNSVVTKTIKEEKEYEDSLTQKTELIEFRNELIRISSFWQPNLNDGVQITSAPLWRFFQHNTWQKKLKQTWSKLEGGDYDWAHLAYTTWPQRVLAKCHADRSLAIAHDVEYDLWHEVEIIKGNRKEPVLEWQPKPLSDNELRAYIKEKISTDERLKLYRSNNANGGA